MKNFRINIAIDCVLLGALTGWLAFGSEGAGNLFKFVAWALVTMTILFCSTEDRRALMKEHKPAASRQVFLTVRNAIVLVVCAWMGLYFLATMWALTWALVVATRSGEVKA